MSPYRHRPRAVKSDYLGETPSTGVSLQTPKVVWMCSQTDGQLSSYMSQVLFYGGAGEARRSSPVLATLPHGDISVLPHSL